jgi:WD40 repeat protein/predicted GIY-YIG superfamily endonuclease
MATNNSLFIYILLLEQGNYYVGYSINVERRFREHKNGQGSAWTQLHPPLCIALQYPAGRHPGLEEDMQVKSLMLQYGIDRVRGGSYSNIHLTAQQTEELQRALRHAGGACFRCGRTGHFVNQCNAATEIDSFSRRNNRRQESAATNRDNHGYSFSYEHWTGITGVVGFDTGRTSSDHSSLFVALKWALPRWLSGGQGRDSSTTISTMDRTTDHLNVTLSCTRCGRDNHTADRCHVISAVDGSSLQPEQVSPTTPSRASPRGEEPLASCVARANDGHTDDGECRESQMVDAEPSLTNVAPTTRRYVESVKRNKNLRVQSCCDFLDQGQCPRGPSCTFSHAPELLARVKATKKAPVSSIVVWPGQERKVFTGTADGCWRLWKTNSNGSFQQIFEGNMSGEIHCLAVTKQCFVCGFERQLSPSVSKGMIHIWNLQLTGDPPLELHMIPRTSPFAHENCVSCLFVDTTMEIASGSDDGNIHIWAFDSSVRSYRLGKQIQAGSKVTALVLLMQQDLLWSGCDDGSIQIWKVRSGQCLYRIPAGITGHSSAITSLQLFQAPKGLFIGSASLDGTIKAWDCLTGVGVIAKNTSTPIHCMTIGESSEGYPLVLLGMSDGSIQCRNLLSTSNLSALDLVFTVPTQGAAVHTIASGSKGSFFSGNANGIMHAWQMKELHLS